MRPMVREDGKWRETDWETALAAAATGLQDAVREAGPGGIGCLVSPNATLEELYLSSRLMRGLGSENVDHRLRRVDFSGQQADALAPELGCSLVELQGASAILLVGSNPRQEAPLIAHRIRMAATRHEAGVALINPLRTEVTFPLLAELTRADGTMAEHLGCVLLAALRLNNGPVPAHLQAALEPLTPTAEHESVARRLGTGEVRVIVLGALAQRHPAFAGLRALAVELAKATGARLGYLPEGGNAVGAALAGATPHRALGGQPVAGPGMPVNKMLAGKLNAYLLVGGIESEDVAPEHAFKSALQAARCVIALTPYAADEQLDMSSVILPIAAFAETSGTWVNVEGCWQSVAGAARPPGEARPAWKVLRVLGNLLGLNGFEYLSSDEIRDELRRQLAEVLPASPSPGAGMALALDVPDPLTPVHMYRVDPVVRRSQPLQATREGRAWAGDAP
jgi:NADH-quinone oxidoreductase subunit G